MIHRLSNCNYTVEQSTKEKIMGVCGNATAIIKRDFNLLINWKHQMDKGHVDEEFIECFGDSF